MALVVGSEEKGLPPLVRKRCDAVVAIPQHGALPSLNVGVAGAVACFEVARQRAAPGAALTYAAGVTSEVQKAQRWAATGMSLRHCGALARLGLGLFLGQQVQALHQRVEREHHGEEDDRGHDEEGQQCVDERAVVELRSGSR